jgi:hypothetical protein
MWLRCDQKESKATTQSSCAINLGTTPHQRRPQVAQLPVQALKPQLPFIRRQIVRRCLNEREKKGGVALLEDA